MVALMVLKRGYSRRATPAEIFQCAESLTEQAFPRSYLARTQEDVELFVRWCAAPILMPCVMLVFTDRSGEVFRFQLLLFDTPAAILHRVTDTPVPIDRIERVWVISMYQTSLPSEERFEQTMLAEIARQRCTFVHYLKVKADRLPTSAVADQAKRTPLYVGDYGNQIATAQQVIDAAHIISARRLERGQVIFSRQYLRDQIQLCVPPLKAPSLEMLFMDHQHRFLHYHKFSCRIGELSSKVKAVLASDNNMLAREVQTVVPVVCMHGPLAPLTDQEISVVRRMFENLVELALSPECVAVAGINGLKFYGPNEGGSSPSVAASH